MTVSKAYSLLHGDKTVSGPRARRVFGNAEERRQLPREEKLCGSFAALRQLALPPRRFPPKKSARSSMTPSRSWNMNESVLRLSNVSKSFENKTVL